VTNSSPESYSRPKIVQYNFVIHVCISSAYVLQLLANFVMLDFIEHRNAIDSSFIFEKKSTNKQDWKISELYYVFHSLAHPYQISVELVAVH
jgi:hypothetical protein